jgi:hypothetical protein
LLSIQREVRFNLIAPTINEDEPPVSFLQNLNDGFQLSLGHCSSFACLTLFEGFTDTENDGESGVHCGTSLGSNNFRVFVEKGATLGVAY